MLKHLARSSNKRPTALRDRQRRPCAAPRLASLLQLEGRTTVSDAAARLGVAPSTAHRLLAMLVYRDFAVRDTREYRVGPLLAAVDHAPPGTAELREAARPHMERLMERFGETTTLTVRSGRTARFLAEVECGRSLRVGHRAGMVFPAHRTSGGLALLAELPDDEVAALYAPDRLTRGEEAPDVATVLQHVHAARDQGFALNNGLSERGILPLGHAIRDAGGTPVASIGIAMPASRFEPSMVRPMVAELRQAAREIGGQLET